jgi:glycosyltransferase involved in cell wall biosynthesis
MKISLVTAYYNRKQLFFNTLKSIEKSSLKKDLELIVVDDASTDDQRIEDFIDKFDLDIKLLRIEKKDKWWTNPSLPFNKGFKLVTGEVVIIQNPECVHMGDLLKNITENIKDNVYLNFGCYSVDEKLTSKISYVSKNEFNILKIKYYIEPMINRGINRDGETAWYNHSKYRPHQLHFCSAITKKDLFDLGGFDERFANGIAFDDNEFLVRIKRKKMNIKMVDEPFVIHQYHGNTNYSSKINLFNKNRDIFINYTLKENKIKIQDL